MPRKDTLLQIRMSEDDRDELKNAAAKLNMPMSEFVRTYMIALSRTVEDFSTGSLEFDKAEDILNYNTTSILKSVKRDED